MQWVQVNPYDVTIQQKSDPYGYLPFPLRGASAGQRNASVARTNQWVLHHSRTGTAKKDRTIYDPYGGLPFSTFGVSLGKEKSLAYRRSHFSVRSESDGIAKNERQLWVRILKNSDPYGYLPFPLRGASAGQRNASVARANQWVRFYP